MTIKSSEDFIALISSEDSADQFRAAHESASMEVWLDIIEKHPGARFSVARNKTVPLEILAMLAMDSDSRVRFMVAMKNKLTPELLERLARDSDESVRGRVARHKKTPRFVLERLADDPSAIIREIIA